MIYHIALPWPPSVNHYWRHYNGRTVISQEGRDYREEVSWLVKNARIALGDSKIKMVVDARPPDKRRRDLDNIQKALFDAMEHGGAYDDDSQIGHVEVVRFGFVPDHEIRVLLK